MTQIEESVQSKLQMAEFNKRFSRMTRTMLATNLGGVYMTPARLSFRYEFTPVPSCGSVFVYMTPPQNLTLERVIPVRVHPGSCTGAKFSLRYENSFWCRVNAVWLFVPPWNHSRESLERVVHACVYLITRRPTSSVHFLQPWNEISSLHVNTVWNHNVIPVWNSHRCEFFTCKHPLSVGPKDLFLVLARRACA